MSFAIELSSIFAIDITNFLPVLIADFRQTPEVADLEGIDSKSLICVGVREGKYFNREASKLI